MDVTGLGRIAGTTAIEIAGGTLRLSGTVGNRISDSTRITMGAAPSSVLALSGGLGAGNLLASGELVPVPEPAALLSVPVLLFALSSRELARSRPGAQGV